jgi:hypothetical protein
MWPMFKKVLARSKALGATLGDVVFQTPEVSGQSSRSFLQWRVKKDAGTGRPVIGVRMLADASVGPEGGSTNYINFDIESAQRLRLHLDRCIAEYYRLAGELPPQGAQDRAAVS